MKKYSIRVSVGSTDEVRVSNYLIKRGINHSSSDGVFASKYIHFETDKKTWKKIKKDLGLVEDSVYATFKELKRD